MAAPVSVGGVVTGGRGAGGFGLLRCGLGGREDTALGRGGGSLVVGHVLGLSARWMVWPSQAVVVLVYVGVWASGVGWWAVVVVGGGSVGDGGGVVVVVGVVLGVVVVGVGEGALLVVVVVVE